MNRCALVVDDEQDICEIVKEELERLGFEVEYFLTGEQALASIQRKEFHIAIVDMKLSTPVTGLDVMRAVRQHQPGSKVVAMTGYADPALKEEAEALGVDAFFEKPDDLEPDVFHKNIRELFQSPAA